jgi:photosystem II stability/assembly factor-like uncharacterized protein
MAEESSSFTAVGGSDVGFRTRSTSIGKGVEVFGNELGVHGIGLNRENNTAPADGVLGESLSGGTGVVGKGPTGVRGESDQGTGVHGSSGKVAGTDVPGPHAGVVGLGEHAGVKGGSTDGGAGVVGFGGHVQDFDIGLKPENKEKFGVYGQSEQSESESPGSAGIKGFSKTAIGVMGHSNTNDGIVGSSDLLTGVLGLSSAGVGVKGRSGTKEGVVGESSGVGSSGVLGSHTLHSGVNFGVTGFSNSPDGAGVFGASTNKGYGGVFDGDRAPLRLKPAKTSGHPTGKHQRGEFFVDSNGDLFFCKDDGGPGNWFRVPLIPAIRGVMSITPQISNTPANLNGVAFPDAGHGFANGAIEIDGNRVGIIVATSEDGATWAEVHKTTTTLRDIAFPDILHGWAVGGGPPTILATADGGRTWKPQTSGIKDDPGSLFTAVAFPDTQNGWVVGKVSNGGVILATANGGEKWSPQAEDAVNFADDFRGVAFPDTQHGWAVGMASPEGGGFIVATSNGGKTWERQTTPVTNDDKGVTDLLFGVAFADINHGLAVGENGTILATANGGRTWTSKPSGTDARLFRVAFPDTKHGWAVGETTTGGGVILMTTDGGDTWTPQIPEADPGQALLGVAFSDISHGRIVGVSGTILAVGP